MPSYFILIPILIPIITGILLLFFPINDVKKRNICIETVVLINTALVLWLFTHRPTESFYLFSLGPKMPITLNIDGMSMFFGTLVAFLWPIASLYAFEYMKHEERVNTFMAYYTITYGATLGVAFAGNIVAMYLFYELLTLVTIPLVMHTMTREARKATRQYVFYMIGGTAFAFVGIVFYSLFSTNIEFALGGHLDLAAISDHLNIAFLVYVFTFMGFGVKASVFPFHGWLPLASVAPTPVTALLHAVAVVKSGVFAIMRVTYFCFGADVLRGTWAQAFVVIIAIITIVYGSTMGVREPHFKRRLAYSTISNLSYILLGVAMMSPLGLIAGLSHMVIHAIMKISAFFCAGAVIHQTDKNYIYELDGLGFTMPVTFVAFFISGLSLTGIPLFAGFVSKWNIAEALFEQPTLLSYIGVAALMYSALMTGIYMLTIIVRAWFPHVGYHKDQVEDFTDPNWMMIFPLTVVSVLTIVIGFYAQPLLDFIEKVATGVL